MASMMIRSVARTKLSHVLRRDDKKISSLVLREAPLLARNSRSRWSLLYNTTKINAYSSSIFLGMRGGLEEIDFFTTPDDNPNIMCSTQYHQLMDYYVERGDIKSTEKIMADMNRNGTPPTIVTINKLISAYRYVHPAGVQKILDQMKISGIKPNNTSICALMRAFSLEGDLESVEYAMKDLISKGYVTGTGSFFIGSCT